MVGVFVVLLLAIPVANIHAATLSSASLAVSDPRPSALSSNYTFTGSSVTTGAPGTIKCIKEVYTDISKATRITGCRNPIHLAACVS